MVINISVLTTVHDQSIDSRCLLTQLCLMGPSCCFTNLLQGCRRMETALRGLQQLLISGWLKWALEPALWIGEARVECTGWEPPVAASNPEVVWPLLNIGGLGRAWAAMSSARFNFATWSYANMALSALPGASLALGGDFMRFSQLDCFLAETMVPWNQLFPHIFFSGLQENLLWKEVISIYYSWKLQKNCLFQPYGKYNSEFCFNSILEHFYRIYNTFVL